MRLVDIHEIQLRPEALELAMFHNVVMRHIEIAKETLLKKYVVLVQHNMVVLLVAVMIIMILHIVYSVTNISQRDMLVLVSVCANF